MYVEEVPWRNKSMGKVATALKLQPSANITDANALSTRNTLELVIIPSATSSTQPLTPAQKSDLILPLVIALILIQLLDGILTGIGVTQHGIHLEANPILRYAMQQIGPLWTLVVAKGLAILIICALGKLATSVKWLPPIMLAVAGIYLAAAIIPWTIILSFNTI